MSRTIPPRGPISEYLQGKKTKDVEYYYQRSVPWCKMCVTLPAAGKMTAMRFGDWRLLGEGAESVKSQCAL